MTHDISSLQKTKQTKQGEELSGSKILFVLLFNFINFLPYSKEIHGQCLKTTGNPKKKFIVYHTRKREL